MKTTNYLFASAALTTVLLAAVPAHAQILGGAMRGGVSGTQAAAFGSGFGTVGSAASGHTDLSGYGRAGQVDWIGRVDRSAKAGAQEAARDAGDTKAGTAGAAHQAVGAGEFEASHTGNSALGTARDAAGSTAAASVTGVGQGEAQGRNVDTSGAAAGGLSVAELPGVKSEPRSSNSSPVAMKKVESSGASPNSSPKHDGRSSPPNPKIKTGGSSNGRETGRGAGTHGEPEANGSAAMEASATG